MYISISSISSTDECRSAGKADLLTRLCLWQQRAPRDHPTKRHSHLRRGAHQSGSLKVVHSLLIPLKFSGWESVFKSCVLYIIWWGNYIAFKVQMMNMWLIHLERCLQIQWYAHNKLYSPYPVIPSCLSSLTNGANTHFPLAAGWLLSREHGGKTLTDDSCSWSLHRTYVYIFTSSLSFSI